MDSIGDSSPSAMKISSSSAAGANSNIISSNNDINNGRNNNNNDYINSIVLPPAFVEDPAGFLTSIASRPNPSPDGISLLAGPLSKWFRDAEEAHRGSHDSSNRATMTASGDNAPVHPAAHVAQLYMCAAAMQLREEQHQPQATGISASAAAVTLESTSAAAGIAASALNGITREQQENKNRNMRHRDETLEAVAAAAVLCSDRSAVSSSGILPVLANLVATTSSPNSGSSSSVSTSASATNNKIASSVATSLSNLSWSSSNSFPPLTLAHTAFLQCAVVAEEYEFAEAVIRGTWPLPTSTLTKKMGNGNDDPHASISIILRYYYLRGIVHYGCGRDHYSMAHRCWWTCLSIPIDLVTVIAVQAWKKLTLVQPLLDVDNNNRERGEPKIADVIDMNIDGNSNIISAGNPATFTASKKKSNVHPGTRLPKCTPKGLSKSIRTLIDANSIGARKQKSSLSGAVESREKDLYSVYTYLGPAVEIVDRTSAESLVRAHESILAADGNMDMAQNCLRRVKELQVQTASKMFSVTSIQILARRWKVTPEEASQQLSDAMELGVVPCRVEEDGTVVFLSSKDSARNNTSTNWADLTGWIKLLERMQRMDVNLSISSKYNAVMRKEDTGMIGDMVESTGPRGVEEFYGDPTI